jgi:hypothetical protein
LKVSPANLRTLGGSREREEPTRCVDPDCTNRFEGRTDLRQRRATHHSLVTSFALRFTTAAGERRQVRLGRVSEGWTRKRAEEELQALLAGLRRGIANPFAETPKQDVLFAVFAHERFEGVRGELNANTVRDYEWQITAHLLPFFGTMPLSAIGVQDVDRYRQEKVREAEARREAIDRGRPLRDEDGRRLRP